MSLVDKAALLKTENASLAKQINDNSLSADDRIRAKVQLHENKAKLLKLILEKNDSRRTGVTAKDYMLRAKSKKRKPVYSCGISIIDRHFEGGFETGMMVNVAGQSFAGKTTLILNMIANMSKGRKVAWFNFEMGEKLFCKKLTGLNLNEKQMNNLWIDEDSRHIDKLIEEMELLVDDGFFAFGIDSKMKLHGGKGQQDYQKFSDISTRLSEFAQKHDVLIFFINQMNEEDIKNKRLALKGSGDQQYDSDVVLFMVLEDNPNKKVEDLQRYVICNKNRQTERTFREPININDYTSSDDPIITEYECNMSDNNFMADMV